MKSSFVFSLIYIVFIALPISALAQSYSWTEAGGKVVYGTNPPKSAMNVKSLSTRGLSRYSSSKVISRLGWRGSLSTDIKTEDIKGLENIGIVQEGDLPAIENLPITEQAPEVKKQGSAKLEHAKPKITLDLVNSKIVTRLKVEITNSGEKIANNVAVAFEFRDGTIIPASGPVSIEAGETALYKVLPDLTPVKLNFALSRKSPEKSLKVVLDWEK